MTNNKAVTIGGFVVRTSPVIPADRLLVLSSTGGSLHTLCGKQIANINYSAQCRAK